ncbi:MAG: twin-arginine translocase TatA/TatE family subunit [bacterium]
MGLIGIGAPEIILIIIVIVLLFGAKKIPELMRGLGSGMKEFKKAANDLDKKNENKSDNVPPADDSDKL